MVPIEHGSKSNRYNGNKTSLGNQGGVQITGLRSAVSAKWGRVSAPPHSPEYETVVPVGLGPMRDFPALTCYIPPQRNKGGRPTS